LTGSFLPPDRYSPFFLPCAWCERWFACDAL
jgi:hypothetical protein